MIKTKKEFKGGYRFGNFKGAPAEEIVALSTPGIVTVPLYAGPDGNIEPAVKAGDTVRAGQVIGTGPVHSPIDGTVTEISKLPAVVVKKSADFTSDNAEIVTLNGATADWRKLEAQSIEGYIYNSGTASLDASGIPTRYGNLKVAPEDVERVVVRMTSDELLPFSDSCLLPESGIKSFLEGLRIFKKALPYSKITIAVSSNRMELQEIIKTHVLPDDNIAVRRVSDKYPQGFEQMLVPAAIGLRFPYGFGAVNIGVLVVGVQTVLAVYDAVTSGLPVTSRVIALGGTGFSENVHVQVPVGTPWKAVMERFAKTDREYRFVKNSLLTGEVVKDLETPVTVKDSALYAIPEVRETGLVPFAAPGFFNDSFSNTFPPALLPVQKKLDTNIHGEHRACLSCSFCADACPVGILPNLIHRYVLREIVEESLVQFGIFKCIDCNLCTYVCPSKIPVAALLKKGKQMLTEEGLGNEEEIKDTFTLKGI